MRYAPHYLYEDKEEGDNIDGVVSGDVEEFSENEDECSEEEMEEEEDDYASWNVKQQDRLTG
eukprot:14293162-Ditylum_brightwellii.AAC.1